MLCDLGEELYLLEVLVAPLETLVRRTSSWGLAFATFSSETYDRPMDDLVADAAHHRYRPDNSIVIENVQIVGTPPRVSASAIARQTTYVFANASSSLYEGISNGAQTSSSISSRID